MSIEAKCIAYLEEEHKHNLDISNEDFEYASQFMPPSLADLLREVRCHTTASSSKSTPAHCTVSSCYLCTHLGRNMTRKDCLACIYAFGETTDEYGTEVK